jgi:2-amino-4-hydroxy-6-hydroxymethyldihydropteridine diphosphokinase
LQQKYPQKKITICPNANNSLYQRAIASLLEANMDVSLISEEWFHEQPKLIICGAGHISSDLVKMASCLDFYIKVIDDREEFANKERFPLADEVICDTFDHLERYLEPNAYYIVVTRGHKADFECVETILSHSYEYLGMIGSKKKVKTMLEQLAQKGVTVCKVSGFMATRPYGVTDQPDFLNAVAEIETDCSPTELLRVLLQIEQEMGRKRIRRWGERNIDLDLLLYEDRIINLPDLQVPHPDMQNRDFVLRPLVQIAPEAVHPILKKTIRQLWEELSDKE